MNEEIKAYNAKLSDEDREICDILAAEINRGLPKAESKVWHRTAVWFLDSNPVVGYSRLKKGVQLLFWSGQGFDEEMLQKEGSFKAASIFYTTKNEIKRKDIARWLKKSKDIQWDYKNIVKRKGVLKKIKAK
jgi:hypothetical protein